MVGACRSRSKGSEWLMVQCSGDDMLPPYTIFQQRKAVLSELGANFIDGVDATNGTETMLKIEGKPWLVVWGSPHPNTFNQLFPKLDSTGMTTGASKKQSSAS